MDQDKLNKLRLAAGLSPRYDRKEREYLKEKDEKQKAQQPQINEAANNRPPSSVISEIARRHLNIRNLSAQNSDSLDFHDVSVWQVEAALKAAYKAGQESVPAPKKRIRESDESKEELKKVGVEYDPKGGERKPTECKDHNHKEETKVDKEKGGSNVGYTTPKNKTAKQVSEAKKLADKDYDKDGKLETEEQEHRGVVDKAIKKAKAEKAKKVMREMDLDMDLGDEGGADEMKQRRLDLIRKAVQRVQGGGEEDLDDENLDDEDMGDEYSDLESPEESDVDLSRGEIGDDMDWNDEEDCEYAMSLYQPEDEEAFAAGYDAFVRGMPKDKGMHPDWHGGYETGRMSRMSSVAEGSSEGYKNPKGTKLTADPKSGANAKLGCQQKDVPHKSNSRDAESKSKSRKGLKKIGEGKEVDSVFNKDYHSPPGANGRLDMAQHKGEPHVQGTGQLEKVKVPTDIKRSLKEEISNLRTDAEKVRYRDEDRAEFYEHTAEAFEMLLAHLDEGTKHSLLLAQIDMNRIMSPMTNRLPRNVFMYIVRCGKPASLTELFHEVKVKKEGADLSKECYTK